MAIFNRVVATLLWLVLLATLAIFAVLPLATVSWAQTALADLANLLQNWQEANSTNFLIAQAAFGVAVVLVFGTLFWLELWAGQRRGVRIHTVEGGSAEVDTSSVPPTPYILPLVNVMREDQPEPSLSNEAALANAPDSEDGFFRVRAVFEE